MIFPETYRKDIDTAISILKEEGCSEVYIFGSLASGEAKQDSDLDIAVKGFEAGRFFRIYSILMSALEHDVDLIDLDNNKRFAKHLFDIGDIVRVA
jgi:predicted nucleotidyltransferase